ncbi:peptidoglycan-binding domain-containing protein [Methylobacterium sp. 37f]|uniref:peptidoglycan-binding domain-containing protein n=1 Tax=Methylobacterium sp. 37f TaxID=2817058 RepID=UPI001FFD69CC|nr:peptidoglycan-binding domain-containing protein [Methylobacterium sp. 37f]MCK2055192.1 peptidoglycan-binding protein [Methylobacterium sp. 37f]
MREPQARRDQREIVVPSRSREPRAAGHRRPAARASGRFTAFGALAAGAGRAFLRHPGEVVGVVVVLGAVSMICLNALGYQMGRHPAPIFPKVAAKPALSRVAEAPKPAVPAVKPPVTASEVARPETVRAEPVKAEAAPRTPRDGIGDLIKAGEPAGAETTASVASLGGLSIAQAQRALVKLGYGPLKADGLMGASTRAALERFERDRKLPVKGEPSQRTFRELATRAGVTRG